MQQCNRVVPTICWSQSKVLLLLFRHIGMCVIVPDRLYFVVTDKYHKMGVATYKVLCAKSVKALREMLQGFGFEILRYRKYSVLMQ